MKYLGPRKNTTFRMPETLARKITALAKKNGMSINEWCVRALDKNTPQLKKQELK